MSLSPDIFRPFFSPNNQNQSDFSSAVQKRGSSRMLKKEADKRLHSREHALADDLSQKMGEPKRFAAYLGIAKLYRESDLRGLSRYVLEKENLPSEARGKYFFAALRGLSKVRGVTFKKKQKKKKKPQKIKKGTAKPPN